MKKLKLLFILLFFIVLGNFFSFGQKTYQYYNPDREYRTALELFNKEKYGAAQRSFYKVMEQISEINSEMRINCEYYASICAIELYNSDAEVLLQSFIKNHPEHSKIRAAYYHLGRFKYYKKKYREAIQCFEQVDVYDLDKNQVPEYRFKLAYSYFMINDLDKAKKEFFQVLSGDSKYAVPADYFHSHIAYTEKNYETALKGFLRLTSDKNFGPIVPYYIAQIYYLQRKYNELINYAPALLDSASTKRAPEIARLIGDSYYKTGIYNKAITYLEMYVGKSIAGISREDFYQLGYANYKVGNFEKAVNYFEKVQERKDSISQNTYYHLADCYVRMEQKQFAANAFLSAYNIDYDKAIQEDALFNYAKLLYEMAFNPYNEAITALQKFINSYPQSEKLDEVNTYLVNLFYTTRNYKDALRSIENIKNKNVKLRAAYQKISYYRAVEMFNNTDINNALVLFNKALVYKENNEILALTYYWKGESFYKIGMYDSAIVCYKTFLLTPGAYSLDIYNRGNYNLAYSYFKKKNYDDAVLSFRKYVANTKNEPPKYTNDAYLRLGDCYFIDKDYESAIDYYNNAIKLDLIDADYAILQKSIAQGVLGKYEAKINSLIDLLSVYKKSTYRADAKFELANTYMILNDNEKTLSYLDQVINEFPKSSYVKKALLRKGLILRNIDKDEEALAIFKTVVSSFPGSQESKEALVSIEGIYVDMDKVEDFFVFVKSLSFASVSDAKQDSISYIAAENKYMSNDCPAAIKGFANYLQKFPEGIFSVNANYYKAECEVKANNLAEAIKNYEFATLRPKSKFSENAYLKAAELSYKTENYTKAIDLYTKLEENAEYKNNILTARIGKMRSNFKLKNNQEAINAANILLGTEKLTDGLKQESYFVIAKSALAIDSIALAQANFTVAGRILTNEIAAESRYNLALIQYNAKNYKESTKIIFDIVNQIPSYDYWIAKSFILLSDNYFAEKNYFQAKHTLKSIIDNSEDPELVKIAQDKYNVITELEKAQELKRASEEVEIKFGDKKQNTDNLFEDK